MSQRIQGLHHITICTGPAQGDVDFFVKVMGQRFIKRTLFYDGREPIYHLYFADELGTPGTVMTTFPMRRTGIKGRKGSGQFQVCSYSVPNDSLSFWRDRLQRHDIPVTETRERFGQKYLAFQHPDCGVDFEVVEVPDDSRAPWKSSYVPKEYAVRGFHSWTASVHELGDMESFLNEAWEFKKVGIDGIFHRYEVAGGGPARIIDLRHESDIRQGSWTLGEGTIHHGAFAVPDLETQAALKFDTEGMGFTDFSDRKNRGYFESIYVRTPGGVMFEATHSLGFTWDEDPKTLGTDFKVSPQIAGQKDELLARMNDPIVV
jgi:hydroquinone 1,2-dioxygenase/2,6-dichloro-p-hydroquinone 1,2-dioxygenase/glyoxalase family protein